MQKNQGSVYLPQMEDISQDMLGVQMLFGLVLEQTLERQASPKSFLQINH